MDKRTLLIVEDDKTLQEVMLGILRDVGFNCLTANNGKEALLLLKNHDVHVIVSDVQMPEMDGFTLLQSLKNQGHKIPFILMTAFGDISQAVKAIQLGAIDYIVKPFEKELLLKKINKIKIIEAKQSGAVLKDKQSLAMLALAKKGAAKEVTVLIQGESGTGKEILAKTIHQYSKRSQKPFVAVNCAAIPDNMLESLLFGYEKGAFTGATQSTPGKFELANGGTLLLDEITEMPLALQAKLLRVLQEKEVERLGGKQPMALDVRVIATSNRNLQQAVKDHIFREDLFYRLNVFPLKWLPLRQRKDDILPLADYLLSKHAEQPLQVTLSDAACEKLLAYPWPGNVRELENTLQRALILMQGSKIAADDIILEQTHLAIKPADDLRSEIKKHEFEQIQVVLEACNGNREQAAKQLGVSSRTLRYKIANMKKEGIEL